MRTRIILFLIFILVGVSFSQNRNSVWCFGHYAAIDFNSGSPIADTSRVVSRGSCASICDTSGSLLLYAAYDTTTFISYTPLKAYNKYHQIILNGDSLEGAEAWYHEIVIIPYSDSGNLYYIFYIGVTDHYGLWYSLVDMDANGGLGAVIQKNVHLQNFVMVDCLTAIKHGNGRDWWIFFRHLVTSPLTPNNKFHSYLVSSSGITNYTTQSVGSLNATNIGQIVFNHRGNKMIYINYKGLMELYDFDRCTGIISNPNNIYMENVAAPWPQNWSAEFSPNDSVLYLTHTAAFSPDNCYLVQFDLTTANIAASADTLWQTPFMKNMGQLKLAPDGKIYLTCNYNGGYPYADTVYNNINMHLSVINSPDSLGAACDLHKFSFYLGGKRTYFGLPNNPDYDMPALAGSPCDSLTGILNIEQGIKNELFVYYNSSWQKAFINAKGLKGRSAKMSVYDLLGNVVYTEEAKLSSQYFTRDLNMTAFAKGMYVVNLVTEKERMVKKFIKD